MQPYQCINAGNKTNYDCTLSIRTRSTMVDAVANSRSQIIFLRKQMINNLDEWLVISK